MNRIFAILAALLCFGSICLAQSDKRKPELFTNYLGTSQYLPANIPAETCHAIIGQADKIVTSPEGLKSVDGHDLQIASLNLRTCATTSGLARLERDLAVGLYGEVVSELERRERDGK